MDINTHWFQEIEADYLSWKIKNSTYWLDIAKFFIRKYGKDNVVNCLVKWEWEYKNILWYKWYAWKRIELFSEIFKNRKNSLIVFHWFYPQILMYALIPAFSKAWWRHGIIWSYSKMNNNIKWIVLFLIQIFFQAFIDTIFYVNKNERDEILSYKYKWLTFFLPIPIQTIFWRNVKREKILDKLNLEITSVWTVCFRKNQAVILKAIKKLEWKYNINLNFKITNLNY